MTLAKSSKTLVMNSISHAQLLLLDGVVVFFEPLRMTGHNSLCLPYSHAGEMLEVL